MYNSIRSTVLLNPISANFHLREEAKRSLISTSFHFYLDKLAIYFVILCSPLANDQSVALANIRLLIGRRLVYNPIYFVLIYSHQRASAVFAPQRPDVFYLAFSTLLLFPQVINAHTTRRLRQTDRAGR